MRKIYFHIHKGHPLDPEDNRGRGERTACTGRVQYSGDTCESDGLDRQHTAPWRERRADV